MDGVTIVGSIDTQGKPQELKGYSWNMSRHLRYKDVLRDSRGDEYEESKSGTGKWVMDLRILSEKRNLEN